MSPSPDHDLPLGREPTGPEQAAVAWVVRCDRGLDAAQEDEFAGWLAADPHHRELFREFGGTWRLMGRADEGRMAKGPASPVAFPVLGVGQPDTAARTRPRFGPRAFRIPLAAAAVIALAVVTPWRPAFMSNTLATEIGAIRELQLEDGSTVELNTDSELRIAFTRAERRVQLRRGEAYFRVARNPERPFVVEAASVGVRALGTMFNVRMRPEGVEVLVTEGRVRVAPETPPSEAQPAVPEPRLKPAELGAGERMLVPTAPVAPASPATFGVAKVAADEVQRRLAWQERRLNFSDTPLTEMVEEFNRFNRHKLVITDPRLASMRFGGSFRPDDRVGFVRMLRENFGIHAEERVNETILRGAR